MQIVIACGLNIKVENTRSAFLSLWNQNMASWRYRSSSCLVVVNNYHDWRLIDWFFMLSNDQSHQGETLVTNSLRNSWWKTAHRITRKKSKRLLWHCHFLFEKNLEREIKQVKWNGKAKVRKAELRAAGEPSKADLLQAPKRDRLTALGSLQSGP